MADDRVNAQLKMLEAQGVSKENYAQFLKFEHAMVSKYMCEFIKSFVNHYVETHPESNAATRTQIFEYIDSLAPSETTGYQVLEFKNIEELDKKGIKLVIKLVPVKSDHVFELSLPNEKTLIQEVMRRIDNHANLARSFYAKNFVGNATILNALSELLFDVDCSSLHIDPRTRSMYLDPNYSDRIAVTAYFIDKKGKPYDLNKLTR